MDRRSKNRKREHEAHGWDRVNSMAWNVAREGEVLMQCPCSWFGWVSIEVLDEKEDSWQSR